MVFYRIGINIFQKSWKYTLIIIIDSTKLFWRHYSSIFVCMFAYLLINVQSTELIDFSWNSQDMIIKFSVYTLSIIVNYFHPYFEILLSILIAIFSNCIFVEFCDEFICLQWCRLIWIWLWSLHIIRYKTPSKNGVLVNLSRAVREWFSLQILHLFAKLKFWIRARVDLPSSVVLRGS